LHVESFDDEPLAVPCELDRHAIAGLHQAKLNAFSMQPDGAIGRNIELRFASQ
jgi:hypothetical protein